MNAIDILKIGQKLRVGTQEQLIECSRDNNTPEYLELAGKLVTVVDVGYTYFIVKNSDGESRVFTTEEIDKDIFMFTLNKVRKIGRQK